VETIESALSAVEKIWRGYGVSAADRAALADELRQDLQAAAGDGIGPDHLIGADLPGFARRLADEAGVPRVRAARGRLLATALGGAVLGALAGSAVFMALFALCVHLFDLPRSLHVPIQLATAVYYGVPGAVVIAGAVGAVLLGMRDVPRIRHTARAMGLLLPVAGALSVTAAVLFARSTGYSAEPWVIVTEIGLVLAALGGATVLARAWSLRPVRPVP
jgi:hypothetical protein